MVKKLFLGALTVVLGLLGSMLHDFFVKDGTSAFKGVTLPGAIAGIAMALVLIALVDSPRSLPLTWRWHRYWYFTEILNNKELRHWQSDFARLQAAVRSGERFSVSEVLNPKGERKDLVEALLELVTDRQAACRVVVAGEPGSGKSTAVQRLALDLGRSGVRRLGLGTPIPILVRLGQWQQGSFKEELERVLANNARGDSGKVLSKGVDELLRKGRAVLLLDALDEALGDRRDVVVGAITTFLDEQAYRKTSVVLTARSREAPHVLDKLLRLEVQELNAHAIDIIVEAYKLPADQSRDIRERLESLGLTAPGGLGRNPFWLMLLVQTGAFAGNKGQILNGATETLLMGEWDKPKTGRAWQRLPSRDRQLFETRESLAFLAFQMSSDGRVELEYEKVAAIVNDCLIAAKYKLAVDDVIGLSQDALLLNYRVGLDRQAPVAFRHRLLQQFFAASYWISNPAALTADSVSSLASKMEWWETLILWAALAPDCSPQVQAVLDGGSDERTLLAVGMLAASPHPNLDMRRAASRALVQSVRGGLTPLQSQAADLLGRAEASAAAGFVAEFLNDPDPQVAHGGIAILSAMKTRAAAEALVRRLATLSLRAQLLDALAAMGRIAAGPLLAVLEDLDPEIRQAAATGLGAIADPQSIEPLAAHLTDTDERVIRAAASALVWLGDARGSQLLLAPFQDPHWVVRAKCAEDLGKLGNVRLIEPLLDVLRGESGMAGWVVARALRDLAEKLAARGDSHASQSLRADLEVQLKRLEELQEEDQTPDHQRDIESYEQKDLSHPWSSLNYAIHGGEVATAGSTNSWHWVKSSAPVPPRFAVPTLLPPRTAVKTWEQLDNTLVQGTVNQVVKQLGPGSVAPLVNSFAIGDDTVRRSVVNAFANTGAPQLREGLAEVAASESHTDIVRSHARQILGHIAGETELNPPGDALSPDRDVKQHEGEKGDDGGGRDG